MVVATDQAIEYPELLAHMYVVEDNDFHSVTVIDRGAYGWVRVRSDSGESWDERVCNLIEGEREASEIYRNLCRYQLEVAELALQELATT